MKFFSLFFYSQLREEPLWCEWNLGNLQLGGGRFFFSLRGAEGITERVNLSGKNRKVKFDFRKVVTEFSRSRD